MLKKSRREAPWYATTRAGYGTPLRSESLMSGIRDTSPNLRDSVQTRKWNQVVLHDEEEEDNDI